MKRIFWILMAAVSIGIPWGLQEARGQGKPVRIAYLQNDLHQLACWVALEKRFFDQEGLEVQVAGIFKAGPEMMSAFAAGALDVGYVGEAPATTAVANKAARVVALAQVNTEGSALVVRKGSKVETGADLRGKRLAIPGHATVQDFLLNKALEQYKIKEARLIVLKPPEMISALQAGEIDGFIAWEPYPAKAFSLGAGSLLLSSRDIWKGHPCCVLVADSRFMESQPEKARKIVRAHIKATEYILKHPQEAVRIAVQYTGLDEKTIVQAMKNVQYTYVLNVEGEREYIEFLSRLKYIQGDRPQSILKQFLNLEIVPEVLRK